MKPYETAAREGPAWSRVESDLAEAERGRDALAARTGYFRRAFRSAIDGTLQPYAVRIPPAYDPKAGRKYPLIVFLHGSASDETALAGADYLGNGQFIEMAPRGRGRTNAFTRDGAQEDIEEAIAAVMRDYPIDAARVVPAGFSMGGYGVYRTYFEHPERYRALAVFSGGPALPARFGDPSVPTFVDGRDLARFKNVPLFVFHGGKDGNVPIGPTRLLVETLRGMGGRVEFVVEEETGHQAPNADTVRRFHEWLRRQLMTEDRPVSRPRPAPCN